LRHSLVLGGWGACRPAVRAWSAAASVSPALLSCRPTPGWITLRISPIQIVAALAAAGLALACLYYGSQARGTVAHIMSLPRAASAPQCPLGVAHREFRAEG